MLGCGDDDCLEEDAPEAACLPLVVTTIALEEDALPGLPGSGDDDCLEEDAPRSLLRGGDDDYLEEDAWSPWRPW